MTLKLIVAPPASGKTQYCLDQILKIAQDKNPVNVSVLVPDGYQAGAFRQRLARMGGVMGVAVNTFGRLQRSMLEENQIFIPPASKTVVQQLVRKAIEEIELDHYANIAHMPGFVEELVQCFGDLKRGLVFPDEFINAVGNKSQKLKELALVYQKYQEKLLTLGWADDDGYGWLAVELLENDVDYSPDYDLMIFDGYDTFTEPQYRTLELLAERLPEILLTLPGSRPKLRQIEGRFSETIKRIRSMPNLEEIDLHPQTSEHAPLAHMITALGERERAAVSPKENVRFQEARSQAEEAREAIRWIKTLVVRKGVSLHECVVVIPEPLVYQPHLKSAAREFGIPIRFTVNQPLLLSPAFAAFETLLDLMPRQMPRRQLLDTVRSPYFNLSTIGLAPESVVLLDQVSRHFQVIGKPEIWTEALDILARKEPDQGESEIDHQEDEYRPRLPRPEEALELNAALKKLAERLSPPLGKQSLTGWITWVEDILDEFQFFNSSYIVEDRVVFGTMQQMFRELVIAEEVAGETLLDQTHFNRVLHQTAASMQIPNTIAFNQPAVNVLRNVEGRGLRSRAVAVLGLAESVFPEIQRPDPFLDEELRQELGIEPSIDPHQIGLFYLAVTRADEYLLLSRPYLAADGEIWEPSPFWTLARTLFAGEPVYINPETVRPIEDAASEPEAMTWAVKRKQIPKSILEDFAERAEDLDHARKVLAARETDEPAGQYEGYLDGLKILLAEQFGPGKVWSASRLEAYTTCPYQFFVSQLLGLESPLEPEPGFDARQLGNILHRILEYAYQQAADPTDLESVLEKIDEVSAVEFKNASKTEGFRPTPLWEKEIPDFINRLKETVTKLAEQSAGWKPHAFEARFGMRDTGEFAFDAFGERVLLRGLIDRVDINSDRKIRIVDYKTGSSHQSPKDLIEGRRLQLPLYSLAAQDGLGLGEVEEGFYWQILRADKGSLVLSKFDGAVQGAIDTALRHVAYAVKGVRSAHFPPTPPEGGCPSFCPAASWCWRYQPSDWGG